MLIHSEKIDETSKNPTLDLFRLRGIHHWRAGQNFDRMNRMDDEFARRTSDLKDFSLQLSLGIETGEPMKLEFSI